jgi:predicted regulator of amino acid metabolism with ACT domain
LWKKVESYLENNPAQLKVARTIVEQGFHISEDGKIYCGSTEIPASKIARPLGVDRRVVGNTIESILSEPELHRIFTKIKSAGPFFGDIADQLGFGVVVINANPQTVGIANEEISIRQIIAEDPELYPEPKLTIITEKVVPGDIIQEFLKIPGVERVTIY